MFGIYADKAAYRTHLETPHFKRFREETNDIVKSRKLIDTMPIILGAKAKSYSFKEVYASPVSPESAALRLRERPTE